MLFRSANLSIVVLDNERYGETGGQLTHSAKGVDLAGVARACGFHEVLTVYTDDQVQGLRDRLQRRQGCLFAVVKVDPTDLPRVLPPRDGALLARRFREAVVGEPL